jgi:succinyl-CoA synthetase beta subunit
MNIIDKAVKIGRTSLSEFEAKQLLAAYQIPVTREALADILITIGRIGLKNKQIKEIDINPIIISGTRPVVIDTLVLLDKDQA